MVDAPDFRERAEARNAERALRARDKAEWLRLAGEWLKMAEQAEGARRKAGSKRAPHRYGAAD
jgi:hypothetical protein